jgi:hypothetical protein
MINIGLQLADAYRTLHEHDTNPPSDEQIEKYVNEQIAASGADFRYNVKSRSIYQVR